MKLVVGTGWYWPSEGGSYLLKSMPWVPTWNVVKCCNWHLLPDKTVCKLLVKEQYFQMSRKKETCLLVNPLPGSLDVHVQFPCFVRVPQSSTGEQFIARERSQTCSSVLRLPGMEESVLRWQPSPAPSSKVGTENGEVLQLSSIYTFKWKILHLTSACIDS